MQVLRDNSTAVASEHKEFCAEFRAAWLDDFTVIEEEGCSRLGPCQSLVVQSIKEHFDKVLLSWITQQITLPPCRCWS